MLMRVFAAISAAALFAICVPARAHAQCVAPAGWFPTTPEPTNSQPAGLCDFYQWSWQTFLFVTQADTASGDNRPRFLTFDTPPDLFGPQVAVAFPSSSRISGRQQTLLRLAPRGVKPTGPRDVDSILQAVSNGVLVDQAGRPVFYQIHVNKDFTKFVKDNGFTDREKLKTAPDTLKFPTKVLELKSSWRVLGPDDNPKNMFVTRAMVPRLVKDKKSDKIFTDPTQSTEETVALVGLHVVGVVDGHPEFIWATFEHVDNAPDLPPGMDPKGKGIVDNTRSWTFYKQGTSAADSNKRVIPPELVLDENTQTLKPSTSVFREFAFGGSTNVSTITGLTGSVHKQLPEALDVWKNYFLVGAVWIFDPVKHFEPKKEFKDEVLAGEKKLSNSTMETFTQSGKPNCFSCHETKALPIGTTGESVPAKLLNVSHVLVKAFADMQMIILKALGR